MKHLVLNLRDGTAEQAAAFLRAQVWALDRDERHGEALAPGDLALIHVGRPRCVFIGRARLATAFDRWTALRSEVGHDMRCDGVLLDDVEQWPRALPLDAVVHRIDPAASNPYVQANAAGFRSGIVLITAAEYAITVALGREARPS
ncbi:MAG: hypothetical protein KIT17_09740 [Rubrivivax sp.]|nr:hypothetical protein [Rubrivivax sp.]